MRGAPAVEVDVKYLVMVLAALACIILGGCASTPPPPEDHYYRLLLPGPVSSDTQPLEGSVVVRRVRAEGTLGDRAISYSADAANVLNQYHYHFWYEPPTLLLQHFAVDYLRAAGLAPQVLLPDLGVGATHEVVGRIRRFEHLRGAGTVHVSLELGVIRMRDEQLLLLQTYSSVQPVAGEGMAAVADAFNTAVSEVYARFVEEARQVR